MPCSLLLSGTVQAHDAALANWEAQPGFRLAPRLALNWVDASPRWPSATPPGVLLPPATGRDQAHRLILEHATLAAAWQPLPQWKLDGALGWHQGEPMHLERLRLSHRTPRRQGDWLWQLGRMDAWHDRALADAGHFDIWVPTPWAKEALLGGDTGGDGGGLSWSAQDRADLPAWIPVSAGLSAFRRAQQADGPDRPWQWQAHGAWKLGTTRWGLSLAQGDVRDQGTPTATVGSAAHSHGALDCRQSLAQRVCFTGHQTRLALSAQWQSPSQPWQALGVWVQARQRGELSTRDAVVDWRSLTSGGWAQLTHAFAPGWQAGVRHEWLHVDQRLSGPGATLLAREAGLSPDSAPQRVALVLSQQFRHHWQWGVELGRQQGRGLADGSYGLLRLSWQPGVVWSR